MNQFSIGDDSAWAQIASPQESEFAYNRIIWLFQVLNDSLIHSFGANASKGIPGAIFHFIKLTEICSTKIQYQFPHENVCFTT